MLLLPPALLLMLLLLVYLAGRKRDDTFEFKSESLCLGMDLRRRTVRFSFCWWGWWCSVLILLLLLTWWLCDDRSLDESSRELAKEVSVSRVDLLAKEEEVSRELLCIRRGGWWSWSSFFFTTCPSSCLSPFTSFSSDVCCRVPVRFSFCWWGWWCSVLILLLLLTWWLCDDRSLDESSRELANEVSVSRVELRAKEEEEVSRELMYIRRGGWWSWSSFFFTSCTSSCLSPFTSF